MIKQFVDRWDKNKHQLESWLKNNHPDSYEQLLKKLIELVLNYDEHDSYGNTEFNFNEIVTISNNDYQGIEIFIFSKDNPGSLNGYYYTHNYYGYSDYSESDNRIPNEKQVQDYMTLALHLLQRIKVFEGED